MKPTPLDDLRDQLTQQVLGAKTSAEIATARAALRDWLTAHPEEEGMRWGFEQLAQMEKTAQMEDADRATPSQTAPVT